MEWGGPRLERARMGLNRTDARIGDRERPCTRGAGNASGAGASAETGAMDRDRNSGKYGQCAGPVTTGIAPDAASIAAIADGPFMAQ